MNDVAFAGEMLRMFRAQMPGVIERLRLAADEKNWLLAQRLAHGIKGTALNLDAAELANSAFAYEQTPSPEGLDALLKAYEKTFTATATMTFRAA